MRMSLMGHLLKLSGIFLACSVSGHALASGTTSIQPPTFNAALQAESAPIISSANVTFYLPTGTVTNATCPSGTVSTSNLSATTVYNSDLSTNPAVSGYTCAMEVSHPGGITVNAALNEQGYTATSYPGKPCPSTAGVAAGMYCYIGTLPQQTASVCYNDFAAASGCQGINTSDGWVGVYWRYNSVVPGSTYIKSGNNTVSVPACSANSPLLMSMTTNGSYAFTYTRSVTFEQSYDGYQTSQGACTCNTHQSITGNSPANESCSATSITVVNNAKNAVAINAGSPASFLADSTSNPFTWISGPICSVGTVTQSTPISP